MDHVNSNQPSMERRRSDRLFEPVPLVVRGIDLLGQPFEERTATLALNLHGCRYSSKHHLPKNTWVTLELPQARNHPNVRARVAWVQRPHSIRDFFQVAVELEGPANIWGVDAPPADWTTTERSLHGAAHSESTSAEVTSDSESNEKPVSINDSSFPGSPMDTKNESTASSAAEFHSANDPDVASSPLFRELRKELESQSRQTILHAAKQVQDQVLRAAEESDARRAAAMQDFFAEWKPEFEQAKGGAREEFSRQLAERQDEFLRGLKEEFEEHFGQARKLIDELHQRMEMLRAENDAAHETANRLGEARSQLEAVEAARNAKPSETESNNEGSAVSETAAEEWRAALAKEMSVAQGQWNELLQSSLDNSVQRLLEQFAERSQDILLATESKIREHVAETRQPLVQAASDARETFAQIKTSLDQEVSRARSSLSEIESVAGRTKEYSAQLEAASHDTLNELHRRMEKILEAQSAELHRRADNLAAGISQRVTPALDALQQEFVNRAHVQVEAKLAPHFERVPELLRELSAREVQAEESLRLHRERLRQASENNQREVSAQLATTLVDARNDFESARKDAATKWNEELDASGVRAAHTAAESIGRSSEWFQQEARARLQVWWNKLPRPQQPPSMKRPPRQRKNTECNSRRNPQAISLMFISRLKTWLWKSPVKRAVNSIKRRKLPRVRSAMFCGASPAARLSSSCRPQGKPYEAGQKSSISPPNRFSASSKRTQQFPWKTCKRRWPRSSRTAFGNRARLWPRSLPPRWRVIAQNAMSNFRVGPRAWND